MLERFAYEHRFTKLRYAIDLCVPISLRIVRWDLRSQRTMRSEASLRIVRWDLRSHRTKSRARAPPLLHKVRAS
jgi:hypothetical protein